MAEKTPSLNVLQRINAVMKEVSYIRKTKKVQNYMAVTHDEVVGRLHPLMAKHGLVAVPRLISDSMAPSGMVTSSGNPIFLYQSVWEIDIVSVDDGLGVTAKVSAHANDTSDKAPGKAASYAMKTALLKVFLLETGEEEEQRIEGNVAPLTEEQVSQLIELCDEGGFPPDETLASLAQKVYQVESINEVPGNLFDNAVKRLKKKAADAKRNAAKKPEPEPGGKRPPKEKVQF